MKKISKTQLRLLLDYQSKYRLLPMRIFEGRDDVPAGLSPHIVASWLTGTVDRADSSHLRWLLHECERAIKFTPRV